MKHPNEQQFLQAPLATLPFSDELKQILALQGHQTLADVLAVPVNRWHEWLPFTYHHQQEIVSYLVKHGMDHLLKED